MTHNKRRERRRQIVARLKEVKSVLLVADEFGVSAQTVYKACVEENINPKEYTGVMRAEHRQTVERTKPSTFAILHILLSTTRTYDSIAFEVGVTRAWVFQIVEKAKAAGFDSRTGRYSLSPDAT